VQIPPSSPTVTDFGRHPLASVHETRERARRHLESGAVPEDYKADRTQVLGILNEVLATELICMLATSAWPNATRLIMMA
jgi:hypothetical protein